MVQQFAYVHGVTEISLLSGKKNTKCGRTVFFFSSQKLHQETLITKTTILYPIHRIYNGLQNEPTNFPDPDQIQLGSTKPNNKSKMFKPKFFL